MTRGQDKLDGLYTPQIKGGLTRGLQYRIHNFEGAQIFQRNFLAFNLQQYKTNRERFIFSLHSFISSRSYYS